MVDKGPAPLEDDTAEDTTKGSGEQEESKTIIPTNKEIKAMHKETNKAIEEIKDSEEFQEQMDKLESSLMVREDSDVRVAVIGNVDSGKSTMVGCLTKGIQDDGRGSARKLVFNFNHEAANGRTSSIGQEIMGFDDNQQQV